MGVNTNLRDIQNTLTASQTQKKRIEAEKIKIKTEKLDDEYSKTLIKLLYNFEDVLIQVTRKEEPSILSRYLIDLSKAFSVFYNENKIIGEDKEIQDARVCLTDGVGKVLKIGANLLGMEMPEKM